MLYGCSLRVSLFLSAALLLGVGSLGQAQPWGAEGAATLVYTDVMKVTSCGLTPQEESMTSFPPFHSQES